MADTCKTTADVIAWLRRPREGENAYLTAWRDEIADRLEAAHKRDTKELRVEIERLKEERNYSGVRERERLRANGFAIVPKEQLERGDAAKLREALVKIEKMAHCDLCNVYPKYRDKFNDMIGGIELEARVALSAPPRNCDVGTAQEQDERFHRFCVKHHTGSCAGCHNPVGDYTVANGVRECALVWAQMPYEEGGAE